MKTIFKNKVRLAILGMLVLFMQFAIAQEDGGFQTIKGKVKDKETKKNVVFCSVSIVGSHIGTVTNIDGEFVIKVKNSLNAQEIEFTHIGYKSLKVSIAELKPEENIISLDPASVVLDEVTVRPEDARELMRMSIKKIPENYSTNSFNSVGFYRETIKQRRDYLSISEAIVDIYKASYTKDLDDDKIRIYKGRKSANVKRADTLAVKLEGGPYTTLLFDIVKNPYVLISDEVIYMYDFTITSIKTIDKDLCYEVSFSPRVSYSDIPLYQGKYYVDIKTLAINSAEFSMDLSDIEAASSMFVKKKPIGLRLTPTSTSYLISYKQKDGKYYFNYSRSEVNFKCKWNKKLFNSNYSVMSEMAITDWTMDKAEKYSNKEILKKNAIFEEEVTAFTDDNFWGEYNTIEPDESIQAAIEKYSKKMKKNK
ncbi:MAG: carboxypeptidase-like regulatory domain-containing protein [Bacteroidales bacterium]